MRDFMSHMVARTTKMKAGNLGGLGRHVDRETENHSNKDIDPEKSHLNYDLVQRESKIQTDILNYIDTEKTTTRAIRKDAVLCNEWIISSDKNFFENLSPEETRNYFEVAKDYFAEKYGEKNIRFAVVHMDEKTPHMHMGIVPFDENNKLSAKRMFNRNALMKIQDELPERFQQAGFNIERGEKGSKSKHLSVPDYKKMQADIKHLEKEKNALEAKIEPLKDKTDQLTSLHNEIETEVGILQAQKNGVKREFEEVLDDIQGFQAFNDLVGHMEPEEWRAKLTSDILLRHDYSPTDLEQAERWKSYLVKGREHIPNTFEKAMDKLNKAIDRLVSKIHQGFKNFKKGIGLNKEQQARETKNKALNNRLNKMLEQETRKKEKSLKTQNKDDFGRML